MTDLPFAVVASSGALRPSPGSGVHFDHRWTSDGVVVETDFTGGHLLNLAIAGCVLNDVHREAEQMGTEVDGVRVAAWGDFDRKTWQSSGISYTVEVSSEAPSARIEELLAIVDDVAEIPKAMRSEAVVRRV